jgi:hypothetical protein
MVAAVSPLPFIRRARGGLIGVEQGAAAPQVSGGAVLGEVARETPNIFAMSVAPMPFSRS